MQSRREPSYREIFQRNYGVFSETEQNSIRHARVMIVGCGGVGGTVAIELCRSGIENFLLVEPDVYSVTNMNRQVSCYSDTLGMDKAEALKKDMLRINEECEIGIIKSVIPIEELGSKMSGSSVLMSSADDFAYSIIASRIAKKAGIPSVIGLPLGSLVRVWSNTEESPNIEDYFALPKNEPNYRALYDALYNSEEKRIYARWAQKHCGWSEEWARGYAENELSLAQIAPMTWIASSLAALEILKLITRRWEPVVFPRYWRITPVYAGIDEFNLKEYHDPR